VASTASRYQGATPPDETIRARFDRNDSFVFGFSKIDVVFGRTTLPQARAYYREIAKPSVSFHQKAITSIDPTTRKVSTDQGHYQADVLVVGSAPIDLLLGAVRVGGHHGGACSHVGT
jgi:NADH dehydrogenase FAD-containing subunit